MKKLLLIFALVFASPLAFGQAYQTSQACVGGTSCAMPSISVTSGQTALVGIVNSNTTGTLSVTSTDNGGGSVCTDGTTAAGPTTFYGSTYEVFCIPITATNASEVFTVHTTNSSPSIIGEVVTLSSVNAVNKVGLGTFSSTASMTSPSITTTIANTALVGICAPGRSGSGGTQTQGSGWTLSQQENDDGPSMGLETQVVSSTGSYTATMTNSGSTSGECFIIAEANAPQAATPTFSPNGVPLGFASPATTVTIASSTSGATLAYTTDGTTPSATCTTTGSTTAATQSGTSGITVSLSSVVTLNAIACLGGDLNSSTGSAQFNLLPDQAIAGYSTSDPEPFSEFYNPILNIDTITNIPTQLPLDTKWTGTTISGTQVSAWAGVGTSGGHYAYPAVDSTVGGNAFGVRGTASFGIATRTAEVYPANQFSEISYHAPSSGTSGVAVGTNCAPGSAVSGNLLTVTSAGSGNVQLYINGTLNTTITLAATEGDVYEMRQYGTTIQPLKNGAQITGLSATYTATAATNPPCIGAQGITNSTGVGGGAMGGAPAYNIVMGAVAATNPGVTPIAWGGNTYSNYASGTITSGTTLTYPTWMPDGISGSSVPVTGQVSGNVGNALGGQYALGATGSPGGDIHQAHLLAPFQSIQWAHQFVTMDATAWDNGNNFLKLAALPYNPPSAMPPSVSGCYDAGAIYIGTEPMMQGSVSCGTSVEYCNTHKLHVTDANNGTTTIATSVVGMTGTGVTSVTLSNPRTVSTSTATVYFWGGIGTGATGTATMSAVTGGYQVTGVTVTAGGSYTSAPNVTIVPGSGGTQACAAIANYEIATAIGFDTAVMHGDEVLGVWNQTTGVLSVYIKGGSAIGGWAASTAVTPRVNSAYSPNGTTGTTIQEAGLYQVATTPVWAQNLMLPLNVYLSDGTDWQEVTTAGPLPSSGGAPTWNHSGGTTTSGTVTFTDKGALTTPTTGSTQPAVWGGTTSTCETNTRLGALTPDNTATWQCVGEAATNDTAFQLLGTVAIPGFSGAAGFPGIWANNNSQTGNGEFAFQDVEFGSGDPCTNGKYTCAGGAGQAWRMVWP